MCRALSGSSTRRLLLATEADRLKTSPARPACRQPAAGQARDGSCVHCDSLSEGGTISLCCIATATPQHFTVTSQQDGHLPAQEFPAPSRRKQVCAAPGPCPLDSSRQALEGLDGAGFSRIPLRNCSPVNRKRSLTPGWACRSGVSFTCHRHRRARAIWEY